jgi:hypothetical protein
MAVHDPLVMVNCTVYFGLLLPLLPGTGYWTTPGACKVLVAGFA